MNSLKFVMATQNQKKLNEMREILQSLNIDVLTQGEAGVNLNPVENGTSFEQNALIKAREVSKASAMPAIADDSGLCVYALNNEPGIHSARYGGEGLDDKQRYELLLKNMQGKNDRRAKFVSVIACVFQNGDEIVAKGECEGEILLEPKGDGGFGYDPVFYISELNKTFSQMTQNEKNKISHRAKALNKFKKKLEEKINANK